MVRKRKISITVDEDPLALGDAMIFKNSRLGRIIIVIDQKGKKPQESKEMTTMNIPERAVEILKQAIENIEKRNISYNKNGINYEDYKLTGFESTWEDILECFARLWNNKNSDKAADWVAYSALQAAFVEAGMPQSRASKIFKKYLSGIYMNIKKIDEDEQRRRRRASHSLE